MYNRLGVLIGMSYVLLSYMVLTLYAAMRSIDPPLLRASAGLGASGFYTFRRVYFPLTLPGVLCGALIVCRSASSSRRLMGGQHDIMIAMLIDRALEVAADWPSAADVGDDDRRGGFFMHGFRTLGFHRIQREIPRLNDRRPPLGVLRRWALDFHSRDRRSRPPLPH